MHRESRFLLSFTKLPSDTKNRVKLKIFAFGKLKTPGIRQTADYYFKLIKPWVEIEEIELRPVSVPDKSPATRSQIQTKEGLYLLEQIESRGDLKTFFILDEKGKNLTTLQWAEWVKAFDSLSMNSIVSLCVGSSLGFSSEVRTRAKGSFCLGAQTLPHELARVVLVEQIYRALSVNRKHPYHNEGQ